MAPRWRYSPGGRAGSGAPATEFVQRPTASKGGWRSTACAARSSSSRQHGSGPVPQRRRPRRCERRSPWTPGAGWASAEMPGPLEPHVRDLVAERLGVEVEELVSEVSLRDDLGADSLDLVETAMA